MALTREQANSKAAYWQKHGKYGPIPASIDMQLIHAALLEAAKVIDASHCQDAHLREDRGLCPRCNWLDVWEGE